MRYFFIMNPLSKGGKSQKMFTRIFDLLNQERISYEHILVNTLEDARIQSNKANTEEYDVIVAVGGDGTINGVINGFYNDSGELSSDAHLGIIYTGTSPDFCKSYNIPIDIDNAVKTLINAKTCKIAVGKLTYSPSLNSKTKKSTAEDQLSEIRYFACCANIGIGASIARRANRGIRKYLGDFLGTFVSLIISILKYKANTFKIKVDGQKKIIDNLYNASVGITKYIASGIKVNHNLLKRDADFYLLETKNLNLFNLSSTLKKVYCGKKITDSKTLALYYLKQVEVYENLQNPEIELDGDPIGYLPCKIEIAKDTLSLIC